MTQHLEHVGALSFFFFWNVSVFYTYNVSKKNTRYKHKLSFNINSVTDELSEGCLHVRHGSGKESGHVIVCEFLNYSRSLLVFVQTHNATALERSHNLLLLP